jgi:uncharacterized membrane protein YhhN
MLTLLAGFSYSGGWQTETFWFGLGLVFCLVGDVLLLLPPGWFVGGLSAFLAAHIFYIIGFNQELPRLGWEILTLVVVMVVIDFFGYRRLRRAFMAKSKGRWLRYPVFVYVVVISLMLLSALLTPLRPSWPQQASLLVITGALLFYISDTVLANNRFASPIPYGKIIVIVSYHLAQMAIVSGVLMR